MFLSFGVVAAFVCLLVDGACTALSMVGNYYSATLKRVDVNLRRWLVALLLIKLRLSLTLISQILGSQIHDGVTDKQEKRLNSSPQTLF